MAIVTKPDSNDSEKILGINNGDLQALNEVVEKFDFADDQAALRFALFALLKAEKNVLYVDEGEKKVILTPSRASLKPSTPNAKQETKKEG
jgi:hypothetical protein